MMVVSIIGLLGSVASIISLFYQELSKMTKCFHIVYLLIIFVICGFYLKEQYENKKIKDIELQAQEILKKTNNTFAADTEKCKWIFEYYSFLEKHSDLYPKSFEIANKILEANQIMSYNDSFSNSYILSDVNGKLRGLVEGIAVTK
ncbi:MAG: hypothetical protein J6X43_04910 [Bacteroidales bacterium]|nr:hypothetical protein [Bacteroidales bacterium]